MEFLQQQLYNAEVPVSINEVVSNATNNHNNYQTSNSRKQNENQREIAWKPPPTNYYMVNGNVILEQTGAVTRDQHGEVIAAAAWREEGNKISILKVLKDTSLSNLRNI